MITDVVRRKVKFTRAGNAPGRYMRKTAGDEGYPQVVLQGFVYYGSQDYLSLGVQGPGDDPDGPVPM